MTTATAVKNNVVWFEIPSTAFKRAVAFYETIFGQDLRRWTSWELLPQSSSTRNPRFPDACCRKKLSARDLRVPWFTSMPMASSMRCLPAFQKPAVRLSLVPGVSVSGGYFRGPQGFAFPLQSASVRKVCGGQGGDSLTAKVSCQPR